MKKLSTMRKEPSWIERNITAVFLLSLLVISGSTVLTLYLNNFDPSKSGPFGDTIGGIAGPVINLLAAVLVYLSFSKQTEANDIIIDQIEKDDMRHTNTLVLSEVNSDLKLCEELFSKMLLVRPADGVEAYGLYGVKKLVNYYNGIGGDYSDRLTHFNNYVYNHSIGQDLLYLHLKCLHMLDEIETSLTNEAYKVIARKKLSLFYMEKLKPAMKEIYDHVRDAIYQSNQHANAAIANMEATFILKRIWEVDGQLGRL
jgi:hypothetical protein